MRVAAGAIARKYLAERVGLNIHGYFSQIGALRLEPVAPRDGVRQSVLLPGPLARRRSSRR